MDTNRVLLYSKILTNRLVIRRLKEGDAASVLILRANEENRKFIDRPKMIEINEAKQFIIKMNAGIKRNESLYWGICLKDQNEVIGTVCIWNFSQKPYKAEIGYELLPEHQGKGIMNETVYAVIDYVIFKLKLEYLEAYTSRNNISSIRLLEKNKFSLVKELSKEEEQDQEKNLGFCLYRYVPQ